MAGEREFKVIWSDEGDRSDGSDKSDFYSIRTASAEKAANTLICLINQASFLLGRQIRRLEESFVKEGGFTERLYQARMKSRRSQTSDQSDRSDGSDEVG